MLDENRLALIRRWGMDGAQRDLGIRVEAADHALVRKRPSASASAPPVLVKAAGEDDWRPLVAAPSPA